MLKQLALVGEFQSQDDTLAIVEISVETQHMRVSAGIRKSASSPLHLRHFGQGGQHRNNTYLRFCWISISLRTCFSTRSFRISCFIRHFKATMYPLPLVLARYTRPNFPRPNGFPISKSASDFGLYKQVHQSNQRVI